MERPSIEKGQISASEPTPVDDRTALPELKLTELQKSERPINKEDGDKKKIETIRPWNNYTIATLEGSEGIKIFDEDAKPLEDFKPPLSSKKVVVNWTDANIRKKVGREHISSDPQYVNNSLVLMIDKVPLELRAFAKKAIGTRGVISFNDKPQPVELVASELTVLSDKYVVLTTKEGGFFTFVTKNEKGVTLAPKDWKRLNPSDPLPEELKNEVEKLLDENEGYKQINESHYALITDVGINIFKTGDAQGSSVFSEGIPSVERNMAIDPSSPNIVYYCQSSNPRSVVRLDLSGEANTWKSVAAEFPKKYESVRNLQLDPTGNFFLFYSKEDLVVVTKDGLEEVKRVPQLTQINFDGQGRIRAIDKDGHLVVYEPNFGELVQELDKRRIAKLAAGIRVADIFDLEAARKEEARKKTETLEYLEPLRAQYEEQFNQVLAKITTQEGVRQLRGGFNKMRDALRAQGLKSNEVAFILEGLEAPIVVKEKEFASKSTEEALAV